jgi:hypothetical protein
MSIWDKYPNYSPEELRTLTAVAAETMVDSARDTSVTADLLRLSPKSAATQLQPLLQEVAPGIQREQVQAALEDPEQSSKMALVVLGEIRRIPPLAERVAAAYDARSSEMCGPELLLLAGAVVILAIKVKSFSISKDGVQASFYEARKAVTTFVGGLIRGIPGT